KPRRNHQADGECFQIPYIAYNLNVCTYLVEGGYDDPAVLKTRRSDRPDAEFSDVDIQKSLKKGRPVEYVDEKSNIWLLLK
ncbi:hypothetical protein FRB99_008338, partial [Tulasnella sp. 403]